MRRFYTFEQAIRETSTTLDHFGVEVDTGHWQGVPTEGKPDLVTKELMGWDFEVPVWRANPPTLMGELIPVLKREIRPNLPWADDHFKERVSRVPSNPGEAYKTWPWWRGQSQETNAGDWTDPHDFKFTHTYQERFWPKPQGQWVEGMQTGIHYKYGDLDDLIDLLLREPYTRQAYLPIFFPEDTGAVHGGRIPCTLGYHFLLRQNKLHMWYFLRSCDFVRHFRDDIYLAVRLLLWVLNQLQRDGGNDREEGDNSWGWNEVLPGTFHMVIGSLHYHKGDEHIAG